MSDAEDKSVRHDTDEDFLHRWSRRKLADHGGEPLDAPRSTPLAAESAHQQAATAVNADPPPQLTDADMPPVDSLDGDSDFSVFMSPGVSEQLRTQALRKLFHLPAFNVTDGLNDYDEDYTQFAGLGNMVTHEMKSMLGRALDAEDVPEDKAAPVVQGQEPLLPAESVTGNIEDTDDDSGEAV